MLSSDAPQGVKISGYIFIGLAALNLLAFCGVGVFLGIAASGGDDENLITLGVALCLTLIFTALYVAVGYGLLKLQSWSRIAAIVLAILSLCSFPIGTILGGAVLYFMFQPEAQEAFS
jgi:hypothetical protein